MDARQLLGKLLTAWQSAPHPRVADAVDGLAALLLGAEPRAPLPGSKKAADLEAWAALEKARDPLDFPRLIKAARGGQQADVLRQVKALARWNDPRFARGVLALLESPPYAGVKSRPLLKHLLDALVDAQDVRVAPESRALAGRYLSIVDSSTGGFVVERLEQVAGVLEKKPVPALPAALEQLCREAERLAPPAKKAPAPLELDARIAPLLALVYETPDDDGPRRVLADALLEAGDARGEFIRRQLAGEPTKDLEKNPSVATWLQPLKMAGACSSARGFVDAVALYKTAARTAQHPAWRTVRRVSELDKLSPKDAAKLLDSPQLAAVREVSGLTGKQLEGLGSGTRPWTVLRLTDLESPAPDALARFPSLEELELDVEGLPEGFFSSTPRLRRLKVKTNGVLPSRVLEPLRELRVFQLPRGQAADLALPPSLEELTSSWTTTRTQLSTAARLRRLECSFQELAHGAVLPSLRALELVLEGTSAAPLTGLEQVTDLRLRGAREATVHPRLLASFPRLVSLRADYGLRFESACFEGLEHLVHLSGLWSNRVELPAMPSLLSFECMGPSTLSPLATTLSNNPRLEYLALHWNSECPLYFGPRDRGRAANAWEQLRAMVEPSGVRVLCFHNGLSLTRRPGGGWEGLVHSPQPPEPWLLEFPLEVFNRGRL